MNKKRRLDNFIKTGLRTRIASVKVEKTESCPGEAELIRYLEGALPKSEEQSIAGHVKDCYWCIEQLDQAQRLQLRPDEKHRYPLINWLKKNKWLIGAGIAFTFSFIFSGYFLQFLILTLLMGIKWIFTTNGAKTVIMIYNAWKKKGKEDTPTGFKNIF